MTTTTEMTDSDSDDDEPFLDMEWKDLNRGESQRSESSVYEWNHSVDFFGC